MKISRDLKLRQKRDEELLRAYKEELSAQLAIKSKAVRRDIINKVIATGSPHYHVCYDYAMRVISAIKRKRMQASSLSVKQEMWKEIIAHVDDIISKNPHYSLGRAVAKVLSERRASKFYISKGYAYKLLYEISQSKSYKTCA